ncbi:Signal transduction histidine kinase [Hahella chejuensis KCTC 2396]|uniref:histidine kinase n=1 Tax=Hahella chejuensis (strain KCTC 2396) TaxID=349521 RepID=Q2SM28_HAHCH|nr:HAMP domain-containing sensor histidine kinase [Hahella chejuensis]ABC28296.1 Signal transduction histidine kinase [Hahella chejuensis KCTC 2396]
MLKHKRQRQRSLSVRLMMIFLAAAFAVLLLIVAAFQNISQERAHVFWKEIFSDYFYSLSKDIQPPYDSTLIASIESRTHTQIGVKNSAGAWVSETPPFASVDLEFRDAGDGRIEFTHWRRYFILQIPRQDATIYFYARPFENENGLTFTGVALLLSILLVIFLCFLSIKRLHKPIGWLNQAAQKVAGGDFQQRIPTLRQDELGQLSDTFNIMSAQIESMLNAKRQLLLAISHELRSPLTRMRVAGEMIEDEQQRSELVREIQHMNRLITELLECERLETGHRALQLHDIDATKLLRELIEERFARQRHLIRLDCSMNSLARLDPVRFKLLAANLIDNALKHGEGKDVVASWRQQPDYGELTVEDKGQGVESEQLAMLTDPFYRGDQSRAHTGGLGLGLYLCRQIAKAHGGELRIESEESKGTRVIVRFPLSSDT